MPSRESTHSKTWQRVILTGTLTCLSDLHIGDGDSRPWHERKLPRGRKKPDLETEPDYQSVCWTEDKGPYLPASSLRGSLRNRLDTTAANLLFGYVSDRNKGDAQAGKVRTYDAFLTDTGKWTPAKEPAYWDEERQTAARYGITLDPITGTVEHGRLFSHELVPAGSRFYVELEAFDMNPEALALLLRTLNAWHDERWSTLGAKRSKGWGRMRWTLTTIKGLSDAGLKAWLCDERNDKGSLDDFFQEITPPRQALLSGLKGSIEFEYRLIPDGPILVNEPGYLREGAAEDEHEPDHEYSRRADENPNLPSESLVGALRARARRIVATIAHLHLNADPEPATEIAATLVGELFGDTTRRSALWISNAEADANVQTLLQCFNAIDRFTGGVKGVQGQGALYQANACVNGTFAGRGLIEFERLAVANAKRLRGAKSKHTKHWWKGLLLLVLHDCLEGELLVGWGKAKGYGACRVQLELGPRGTISSLSQVLALEAMKNAESWVRGLHARIQEALEARGKLNTDTRS